MTSVEFRIRVVAFLESVQEKHPGAMALSPRDSNAADLIQGSAIFHKMCSALHING